MLHVCTLLPIHARGCRARGAVPVQTILRLLLYELKSSSLCSLPTFVPCLLLFVFRFFFFLFFFPASRCLSSSCPFVCAAAICYSQQVLRSTYFIMRVLSACVICTLTHLGILLFFYSSSIFFRSSYFSGGIFFVVLSYPVR